MTIARLAETCRKLARRSAAHAAAAAVALSMPVGAAAQTSPPPAQPQAGAPAATQAQPSTALAVKDFLAPQSLSEFHLSPGGDRLAYVRTDNEVDALVVLDLNTGKPLALLKTRKANEREAKEKLRQRISYVHWKSADRLIVTVTTPANFDFYDNRILIETPVHFVVDASGKTPARPINEKNPGKKSAAIEFSSIANVLRDDPDHLLMTFHHSLDEIEIDRVDIRDGSRVLVERGEPNVTLFGIDRKGNIVTRYVERFDGSITVQGRPVGQTRWTKIFDISRRTQKEASEWEILGFGGPDTLYITAKPIGATKGDTREVRTYDLKTATVGPVVWSHPLYDVDDVVIGEESGELLAGCYWADVYQCDFKDPNLAANLKGLSKYFNNARSIAIVSKSSDDKQWVLDVRGPEEPGTYYLYDVAAHNVEPLGPRWPELKAEQLGRMRRFDYKARDGADLFAYVTEPPAAGSGPAPLVVLPHGGPEMRDHLEFDTWVQFLATRGYLVLQPNFRGSGGFGRKFAEAGYGEWGGRMHDDVTDAVKALIAKGRVDPSRICIVGASYGGYEALWAAHAEPQLYKCAASIDGLSDLKTDIGWERRFGGDSSGYKYWLKSMGDPKTDLDRLVARSPAGYAKTWTVPVLLIHGDKDDIVDVAQSRIMKRALEAEHKQVRYVEIKKMGHGPETDEEWTQVLTELDSFLAPYLRPADVAAAAKAAPAPAPTPAH